MVTAPDSRGRSIVSMKNKGGEKDVNWRENNKILSSTELVGYINQFSWGWRGTYQSDNQSIIIDLFFFLNSQILQT